MGTVTNLSLLRPCLYWFVVLTAHPSEMPLNKATRAFYLGVIIRSSTCSFIRLYISCFVFKVLHWVIQWLEVTAAVTIWLNLGLFLTGTFSVFFVLFCFVAVLFFGAYLGTLRRLGHSVSKKAGRHQKQFYQN